MRELACGRRNLLQPGLIPDSVLYIYFFPSINEGSETDLDYPLIQFSELP